MVLWSYLEGLGIVWLSDVIKVGKSSRKFIVSLLGAIMVLWKYLEELGIVRLNDGFRTSGFTRKFTSLLWGTIMVLRNFLEGWDIVRPNDDLKIRGIYCLNKSGRHKVLGGPNLRPRKKAQGLEGQKLYPCLQARDRSQRRGEPDQDDDDRRGPDGVPIDGHSQRTERMETNDSQQVSRGLRKLKGENDFAGRRVEIAVNWFIGINQWNGFWVVISTNRRFFGKNLYELWRGVVEALSKGPTLGDKADGHFGKCTRKAIVLGATAQLHRKFEKWFFPLSETGIRPGTKGPRWTAPPGWRRSRPTLSGRPPRAWARTGAKCERRPMIKNFFIYMMAVSGVSQSMKLLSLFVVHEFSGVITTMKISCVCFIGYGRFYEIRLESLGRDMVFCWAQASGNGRIYVNSLERSGFISEIRGDLTLRRAFLEAVVLVIGQGVMRWLDSSQPVERGYNYLGSRKASYWEFERTRFCPERRELVKIAMANGLFEGCFLAQKLKELFRGLGYRKWEGHVHGWRALRAPCGSRGNDAVQQK
jgi:hypothetical protein